MQPELKLKVVTSCTFALTLKLNVRVANDELGSILFFFSFFLFYFIFLLLFLYSRPRQRRGYISITVTIVSCSHDTEKGIEDSGTR